MKRRTFIGYTGVVGLSFLGLQKYLHAEQVPIPGDLLADPNKLLDLPEGFSYKVISEVGKVMDDGFRVPGLPDGMAAFDGGEGKTILVRNHELAGGRHRLQAKQGVDLTEFKKNAYDSGQFNGVASPGGTTNLLYNHKTQKVEKQYLSLAGTEQNCAGGVLPGNVWLTCEEPSDLLSKKGRQHGYCFAVKAVADGKLQKAEPLKALGRFRHEAVAMDTRSGILYLTEDMSDGLLYRFIPKKKNDLTEGKLQALMVQGNKGADLRNYKASKVKEGQAMKVEWIDVEDIDSPKNDLRHRGYKQGAAVFARGEGIVYSDGEVFICCTDGGLRKQGQIFKLTPAEKADQDDVLELFLEPKERDLLTNGDNLCFAPWGGLVICEDLIAQHRGNRVHMHYVNQEGKIVTFARNARDNSEFAGCTFSMDGEILFVNMQGLGKTLAITGPWKNLK